MPRYFTSQDAGMNALGGIFQALLDRRQRNWDQEDMASQQAQQLKLQGQRQEHQINLVEMGQQYKTEAVAEEREYQEGVSDEKRADKWFENFRKMLKENKSAKGNRELLQKYGITPSADPEVNRLVLPAIMLSKAGVTRSGGAASGDKPMDFQQALNLAQDLKKTATPEAQETLARKWVDEGATKRSVASMTGKAGELFPGGEVPQQPPTLQQQAQDSRNLAVKYGHEYLALETTYRGLNDILDVLEPTNVQRQMASMVSTTMQELLKNRDVYGISDEQAQDLDAMHHLGLSHTLAGIYLSGIGGQGENSVVYTEFPQDKRNEIGRRVALMAGQKDFTQDVLPEFASAEVINAAFRDVLGITDPVFPSLPGVQVSLDDLLVKMFEMRMDDEQMAQILHYVINGPPSTEPGAVETGVKVIGDTLKNTGKKFLRIP